MRTLKKKELMLLKRQVRRMMKSIRRLEENTIIIMEMIDKGIKNQNRKYGNRRTKNK